MYARSYEMSGIFIIIHFFPSNFVIYLPFHNGCIVLQWPNENLYSIGDSSQHSSVPSVM